MPETFEKNIRFKAILIYLTVALICGGMLIYIYKLRGDIDDQKRNVEQYYNEQSLVTKLIEAVNNSQKEVNLYVSTKQAKHYKLFGQSLVTVEQLMDSLVDINPLHNEKLQQVNNLLVKKGQIVSSLNKQFSNKNPIEPINEVLRKINPIVKKDTILVSATIQDTTIYSGSKKGFWKKLSELFSQSKEADTVTSIATSRLDTLTMLKADTLHVVSEIKEIAEQAKDDYVKKIISIERNLNSLIIADQEISSEISTLLIKLYNQTVQTRLDEIQKSEQLIRSNNNYTIISGGVALTLILIFILLIINDVNKSVKLRKNLEKANNRIQQIMDSRHRLLLSVSHDIKTPLNSILGTLELKGSTNFLFPNEVRTMKHSGDYILALLSNLLEFSSIEQGTSYISYRSFNLYDLCKEISDLFVPLVAQKGLSISHSFDFDKNLILNSDSLKIKQIFMNILSNSVKYTSSGSIRFDVKYVNERLYCNIQDSGVGIPTDKIDDIFLPFRRIDNNSHLSEGSGFGMFVVKGLIDLFNGDIKITSKEGKGTSIEISIPIYKMYIDELFVAQHILIIDDDTSYSMIIRNMLLRLGHIPSICNNRNEFQNLMPQIENYDKILTDMEMECFSGMDVLHEIKERKLNIPITIITAKENINGEDLLRLGFKTYLKKPISITDLRLTFGGKIANTIEPHFESLYNMLEKDSAALYEVLTSFISTTTENLDKLRSSVLNNDFKTAQFICHKMIPMLIQLEATDILDMLKKIDSFVAENVQDGWENDIIEVIEYIEEVLAQTKIHLASL